MDRVVKDNEPVIVARKKRGSVVLVSLAEWNSIQETLYLNSTRANARALMDAMDQADRGEFAKQMTMAELRAFVRAAGNRRTRAKTQRKTGAPKRGHKRNAKAHRDAAE
jgi:antitoxin YefM